MNIVRCIPVVGTVVSGTEALVALVEGDMKKFALKATQATVGGVMDAAFVVSGGASAILTAPLKVGAVQGGKIVVTKAVQKAATNVVVRGATEVLVDASGGNRETQHRGWSGNGSGKATSTYTATGGGGSSNKQKSNTAGSASGSGNDPPRYNGRRQPGEHELDDQSDSTTINELVAQHTMATGQLSTPEELLRCLDVVEADTSPTRGDTAGYVYLYARDDPADVGECAKYKVGSTKLKPEDRMRASARANEDNYRIVYWIWTPYCRLTERIVHAMARNSRIPRIQNTQRRTIDGGTEWFRDGEGRLKRMMEVAKEHVQKKYDRNTN